MYTLNCICLLITAFMVDRIKLYLQLALYTTFKFKISASYTVWKIIGEGFCFFILKVLVMFHWMW
jgi:hypothetical protein